MRNILEAFFRRRTSILLIILVAALIIILGTFSRTPQYMSQTRFMIPLGRELGTPTGNLQSQTMLLMVNYTDQIATQMEVLNNRRLVEDALAAMPLEALAKRPPSAPLPDMVRTIVTSILPKSAPVPESATVATDTRIERLVRAGVVKDASEWESLVRACAERLKIERQNDSGVIHIKFTNPSPDFAQAFLAKFLEAYEVFRAASGTAGSDMPFYAGQEDQLRKSLREASDRLAAFRKEWGLLDIHFQREQNTTELARLDKVINESRSELTQATAFLEALQTEEAKREPESILSRVMRDDPGMVHNLRSIAALLARESRLRAEVGRDHPELTLIQSEMRELRDGLHRTAVQTLQAQALNARVMLEESIRQREETEGRMATLEAKAVEMRALESEVEVAGDALLAYGKNREAARVTSQMDDKRINTLVIIEPPTRPYSPESPKPARDIAIGLVFAIFLALYYAYFMESITDIVYTMDAVANKFPDTAVVALPELKENADSELPVPESALAMLGRKFFYKDKHLSLPKSILVVGSAKGAGATSLSRMLSQFMARTYNIRVLLVDAGLPARGGERAADGAVTLTGWLLDRAKRPEACAPGQVRVLPAGSGGAEARAAMLRITHEELASLGDFDMVIFDAAPLNADSVTFHLAALTEATLPVVRMEHTRKAVLESMNDELVLSGASVLGVVCNRRRFYIPQFVYKLLS